MLHGHRQLYSPHKSRKKSQKKCVKKQKLKLKDHQKHLKSNQLENEINYLENNIQADRRKENNKDLVKNNRISLRSQENFRREKHTIFTEEVNKLY